MKKLLFAGLLALPLAALPQQASAWCKFNLGIGANLGYQSGGSKSFLWGAWQSTDVGAMPPNMIGFPSGYTGGPGCGYGAPTGYGGYGGGPGATELSPSGQDFSEGWMSPLTSNRPGTAPAGTPDAAKAAAPAATPPASPARVASAPKAKPATPADNTATVGYTYTVPGYNYDYSQNGYYQNGYYGDGYGYGYGYGYYPYYYGN
jgi:hypothetical protein